jgi:inorganic pyrophosphatase
MNLWHDVPRGTPEALQIIIEIPKGSLNKYEIDKETGLFTLDRVNYSAATYPCEYAFAPQTLWDDGDALDVLVLATTPIDRGTLVTVRPIGIMHMNDSGESDDKIIAIPMHDKRMDDVVDINDISHHRQKELAHFFETYKELKGGKGQYQVTISGFSGKEIAQESIKKSFELYDAQYKK